MKINFDTAVDKNNLVEFLKSQSQEKDEILYDLLKEPETHYESRTAKGLYKTERELHPEKYKGCYGCYHSTTNGCMSEKVNRDGIDSCIKNGYKYWEDENGNGK